MDSKRCQLNQRGMQARENTFCLAFGLGIGSGLVELARLFECVEGFQEDFVDFGGRHARLILILSQLIIVVLGTLFRHIRVQGHRILRFNFWP